MSDPSVKEIFVLRFRSLLEVLCSSNSGDEESFEPDFDDLYTRANLLYHHGVRLASVHMIGESTITKLRHVVDLLTEKREPLQSTCFYANTEQRTLPGRPKFVITESQLSYLSDHALKAVDMARMFDVSVTTIHRRLNDFNMSIANSFSNIDNNALDSIILNIKQQHPNSGYRMALGHLRSRRFFIQQTRVRKSMRRVDPEGTVMRWLHVTERREYNVISPNALWHIDGNHKLIRSVQFNNCKIPCYFSTQSIPDNFTNHKPSPTTHFF